MSAVQELSPLYFVICDKDTLQAAQQLIMLAYECLNQERSL